MLPSYNAQNIIMFSVTVVEAICGEKMILFKLSSFLLTYIHDSNSDILNPTLSKKS